MTGSGLRVLAVTNMYPTSDDPSFGVFVASQMESVAALGHEVTIEFINGRAGSGAYGSAITGLRRLAGTGRFDLVHAHYGLTGFVAGFQPLPLVVSFCGDDLLGTPDGRGGLTFRSRIIRGLSRNVARRAHEIICKSEGLRAALPRAVDRERAHVIPNGVDLRRFHPGDRATARAALGVAPEETLVLFPHTPGERRKRFDLAEAAVELLRRHGRPVRLWVVHGQPQDRMPAYYQAANCLLLTSDWEGSPNVVKEALCCNCPVVAVDAGDVGQWTALVPPSGVFPRQPEALAAGIRAVLDSPVQADGEPVRSRLGLPVIAERIVETYHRALRARSRPAA